MSVEHQLTAGDLLRLAGGEAYCRGLFAVVEGLVGRWKVIGDTVHGSGQWFQISHTRLQLVPPFENRCSCPKGGNCSHVVTLGLAFLDQEREKSGASFPPEERCYYLIAFLDRPYLRWLAMELLAAVPEATPVAMKYLDRPGHWREWDAYVIDDDDEDHEEDYEEDYEEG